MSRRFAIGALFALCLLIGILPVLSMLASVGIAEITGCNVNEGGSYPCIIFGADWGEVLSVMFVAAWFFFLTFPLAVIGLIGLVVMGILAIINAFRR